jgi:hypothetical protein
MLKLCDSVVTNTSPYCASDSLLNDLAWCNMRYSGQLTLPLACLMESWASCTQYSHKRVRWWTGVTVDVPSILSNSCGYFLLSTPPALPSIKLSVLCLQHGTSLLCSVRVWDALMTCWLQMSCSCPTASFAGTMGAAAHNTRRASFWMLPRRTRVQSRSICTSCTLVGDFIRSWNSEQHD